MVVGYSQGIGRMSVNVGAFHEWEVNTLITPDRTTIQVRSSGLGRAGIGRSSWKDLNTGRHEKSPARCPCTRLTAFHGASRTLLLFVELLQTLKDDIRNARAMRGRQRC